MVVVAITTLGKAEPLISTAVHQKFDLDPNLWPKSNVTWCLTFDLDLLPTTLTYNNKLAKVTFDLNVGYFTFNIFYITLCSLRGVTAHPNLWPKSNVTRFLTFDLDLLPMTLTYNHNLAKVTVDLHAEYQGRLRSKGSGMRALTDGQTLRNALSPYFTKLCCPQKSHFYMYPHCRPITTIYIVTSV